MTTRGAMTRALIFANLCISAGSTITGDVSSARAQTTTDAVVHPSGCIAIHQESGGLVHFEVFLVDPSRRQLVPIEAYRISVQIRGKQTPVWEAQADNYSSAHRITYGVPPKGFQDHIHPEQLMSGVSYRVTVRSYNVGGVQRVFLHEGAEKKNTCPWDGNPRS